MLTAVKKTTLVVPVDDIELKGDLSVPEQSMSMVIFAHGSGSSRLSPRNQMVAEYLNGRGIATFLFDLLTYEEDRHYVNRFNIPLLASRLHKVTVWLTEKLEFSAYHVGYFGASTGAAAALVAASTLPEVHAVVSRGGRPDLAKDILPSINASCLFIVGSLDMDVIRMNQQAFNRLTCNRKMEIIEDAGHLFQEKGAMEKVCLLAANWFEMHLHPSELIH